MRIIKVNKTEEAKPNDSYNWPNRRTSIWPVVAAAGAIGAAALLLAPGEKFDDPEFVVQGSMSESDTSFQAGIRLDCNERGVLEAIVSPQIDLVVERDQPALNQDEFPRFRRMNYLQISTGEGTCDDALETVRSDLSLVSDPLTAEIESKFTQIFGDGNSKQASKYLNFLTDHLESEPTTPVFKISK